MLEPRTAGESILIEERALHLIERVAHLREGGGIALREEGVRGRVGRTSRRVEIAHRLEQRGEIGLERAGRGAGAADHVGADLVNVFLHGRAVVREAQRSHVGGRGAEGEETEVARRGLVIDELRIAEVRHPVEVVVDGVIHAVVAAETAVGRRHAEVIDEGGVVGARPEPAQLQFEARVLRVEIHGFGGGPGGLGTLFPQRPHHAALSRLGHHVRGLTHRVA